MSSREQFEAWMTAEQWFHDSDFDWDERRNCYSQFGIHLAYKSWQAATSAMEAKCAALADLFGDVKEIFGFKYRYFITSKGLIFSLSSGELKQLNPTMRGKNRNQYLFVRLELEGKLKGVNIHRLVAENFIGPKPSDEHVINHKDGNKQNNDVSNLEWTTIAGNTQHAYRTGLAGGRKHGSYKGPVCAENEEGFGYVFFDSKQAIEAGFNPNSIRDAVVKPWKKVFGFYFSRINTEAQLRQGGAA